MTRQLCIEFKNAFYHVMSRGLNRQNLFTSNSDFIFFLYLMNQAKDKFDFICHSYCLMNNHYHLYLQTLKPNLSLIMKYLNENYARYFLKNNIDKDGHVFKGRYKRTIVESDSYSLELSRYIHLNPVRAKLVKHPHEWGWSSYASFMGLQPKHRFMELNWLLKQFANTNQKAREKMMQYSYEGMELPWDPNSHTLGKLVIGSKEFFDHIITSYVDETKLSDEILSYSDLKETKTLNSDIIKNKVEGLNLCDRLKEKLLIYYLREHTNLSLCDISKLLNRNPKAISKSYSRTKTMLDENKELTYLKEIF